MADFSTLTVGSDTYNVKDKEARNEIENLKKSSTGGDEGWTLITSGKNKSGPTNIGDVSEYSEIKVVLTVGLVKYNNSAIMRYCYGNATIGIYKDLSGSAEDLESVIPCIIIDIDNPGNWILGYPDCDSLPDGFVIFGVAYVGSSGYSISSYDYEVWGR